MSDAQIDVIADAIFDFLKTVQFEAAVNFERPAEPRYDIQSVKNYVVTVMEKAERDERATRSTFDFEFDIDVVLQKKIDPADRDQKRACTRLVEEIRNKLVTANLDIAGLKFIKREANPLWNPEHLSSIRQYTNVSTYTFGLEAEIIEN